MQDVRVPPPGLPPLQRSVVACLASMLDVDPAGVPLPPADHPEPWTVWRGWLGQRRLGLVPVLDPAGFSWPGPWLALLRSAAGEQVAAVAFGAPPGIAWHPLGGPEGFEAVEAGYVVAPTDAAQWSRVAPAAPRVTGVVELIALAPAAEAPARRVVEAAAHAGRGLAGDRYFAGRGTFSNAHARGHDLTLIEAEALDELAAAAVPLAPEAARRNLVTRGIDLDALVGRRFRVGEVTCLGRRPCEPCAHLERLTVGGTLRGLVHRGGLRADVLSDGTVRVGDVIAAE